MKKLRILLVVAMMLCAALFVNAQAQDKAVSLADWEGVWNSYAGYLDDAQIAEALEKIAAEKGITPEQIKAPAQAMMRCEFAGLVVKGDEASFLDNFESRGGKETARAEYAFVQKQHTKFGEYDVEWAEFAAKGEAKYPVILLVNVHEEDGLTHFHLRYGKDVKDLMADEMTAWYPTFVAADTSYDVLITGLRHAGEEMAEQEKEEAGAETTDLSAWDGTWNNMGAYLDDRELEDAFKKLAEKDKVTAEEAKAKYAEKRRCDFDGMVIRDGAVTLLDGFEDKGGKAVGQAGYAFAETRTSAFGGHELTWHVFKAYQADARYPVLMLMKVDSKGALTHFHLRYGADADELLKVEGWFPTFVRPDSTYGQLAGEIAE